MIPSSFNNCCNFKLILIDCESEKVKPFLHIFYTFHTSNGIPHGTDDRHCGETYADGKNIERQKNKET